METSKKAMVGTVEVPEQKTGVISMLIPQDDTWVRGEVQSRNGKVTLKWIGNPDAEKQTRKLVFVPDDTCLDADPRNLKWIGSFTYDQYIQSGREEFPIPVNILEVVIQQEKYYCKNTTAINLAQPRNGRANFFKPHSIRVSSQSPLGLPAPALSAQAGCGRQADGDCDGWS